MLFSVEQAFIGGGGGWKTSSPKNTCVGGYTYTCKVAFLLIRPIVVFFTILRRCLRHLALHDFIVCLSWLNLYITEINDDESGISIFKSSVCLGF